MPSVLQAFQGSFGFRLRIDTFYRWTYIVGEKLIASEIQLFINNELLKSIAILIGKAILKKENRMSHSNREVVRKYLCGNEFACSFFLSLCLLSSHFGVTPNIALVGRQSQ